MTSHLNQIKVLIVDDDDWWLDFANKFLSKINSNYAFLGTTDPKKVVDILKQDNSIDIVISDYQMSEMNGIDLLIEVKRNFPNMPFILLTGRANKDNFLQSIKHGANYVISKNDNIEYLFELLNYYILQAIKESSFWISYENKDEGLLKKSGIDQKVLDLYLKGLHHDINNLKSYIISSISLFDETKDKKYVKNILNYLKVLDKYSNDESQISYIKNLQKLSEKDYIHLPTIISEITAILTSNDVVAKVKLDNLPLIFCEINQINQVFYNIIENAITHSSPNFMEISYKIGSNGINIYVKNDGKPISKSIREDIFKYGFTTKDNGTGLGLSIVKDICDQNKWEIKLISDEMTTFQLFIPGIYLKDFSPSDLE